MDALIFFTLIGLYSIGFVICLIFEHLYGSTE